MSSRILLNVVVLALIGLAFIGITSVINLMAATDVAEEHEFSFVKRTADDHWENKNWSVAGRYYLQLAESDSYNSGAHLKHALSLSNQIVPLLRELNAESDAAQVERLKNEIEPVVELAIVSYAKILKFAQFRSFSRFQLAKLHGYSGDKQLAVEYLIGALRDGYDPNGQKKQFAFFQCEDVYLHSDVQELIRNRNDQALFK